MTRHILMIPGPVELSPAVYKALAAPIASHVSPTIIEAHGAALENMRRVWLAGPKTQPFIIAGSGTIAMEMAITNICEAGDKVIVLNSGYFGDRNEKMLKRLGVEVHAIKAEKIGGHPDLDLLEKRLSEDNYKAVFGTHVDTSTGVRLDVEKVSKYCLQNETLSIFDGVCATAAETFRMQEWGADVYYTASQKALGLPPGLALMVCSEKAIEARQKLKAGPPLSLDWLEWAPIMEAYENRKGSYFSTPATGLISALDISLKEILSVGMEDIFSLHQRVGDTFRDLFEEYHLCILPESKHAANTLSAVYYGEHTSILEQVKGGGYVIAGGLHPEIKATYFRIGHMGYSAREGEDIQGLIDLLKKILSKK